MPSFEQKNNQSHISDQRMETTMETLSSNNNQQETPVSQLPVWTPWVLVNVQSSDSIPAGRAATLGNSMTKHDAWAAARREMEMRADVVAIAVRRDGEAFQ